MRQALCAVLAVVFAISGCARPVYYIRDQKIGHLENTWAQFVNENADTYTYVVVVYNPPKRSFQEIRIDPGMKSSAVTVPIGDVRISWRVFKNGRRHSAGRGVFLVWPTVSFNPVVIRLKEK